MKFWGILRNSNEFLATEFYGILEFPSLPPCFLAQQILFLS